ncbi:Neutral/alkaline non-lysosomal ceramidase [Planctomycetes bacterium Pan216]|uniref:Neutral/alkaline non-lysosomal ceramidase n=1 Tax=Kolteria novifilia TaxID=2527975 RepID=A0A518BAL4_9BACT|nr:Neutral/alkaline non-lysosomal ceramidase [Planctomycetes bacterium Pan216]
MIARRFTLPLVLALGCLTISQAEAAKVFKAGAVAQDITPTKFPVDVNGGMSNRTATAAHDRMHARCLVLDDGTTKLAFAVCDSCLMPRFIMDQAKKIASKETGIPTSHILISATHTHSAPAVTAAFQTDPDENYVKEVPAMIAAGIINANKRLAPAQVGWGVGEDPTQVFNRRWYMKEGTVPVNAFGTFDDKVKMNPPAASPNLIKSAGPTDPEVSLLAVRSPDGKPMAVLTNYSLHYVGGTSGGLSADYFAVYADRLGQLLDADKEFVGIMSNGTSGDINNIDFSKPRVRQQPFEQIRVVADSVARVAYDTYQQIEFRDWVSLDARQKEISGGVRKANKKELAKARELLKNKKEGERMKTLQEIYAREAIKLADYPDEVDFILQAFRVGELGIASIPCETFVEIGLAIKEESPFKPTFVVSLANGYNGYLPTRKHHGLKGYETWRARSSYLEVDVAEKIEKTLLTLLDELATAQKGAK